MNELDLLDTMTYVASGFVRVGGDQIYTTTELIKAFQDELSELAYEPPANYTHPGDDGDRL